ncbi:extracellular solute-binding protein [Flexivirga caeni]|uniref:Extracellular solute-binding protein n=1 Tax=Flexivirga caeni TaxID=2294115 RepID=A0A3M9M5R8_9MICO|nr:extracellular solute-binding protein [Flexivirga caeni]RNI20919.1 extracellular solute-binding protein [Flexivirga caeni]
MRRTVTRRAAVAVPVGLLALDVAACSSGAGSGGDAKSGGKVAIVGFSVLKPGYDALTKAFTATAAGKGVAVSESFGPSGSQSKAVSSGQPADFVGFSLAPDMTKLAPKFVAPSWDKGPTKGIGSTSVVVIVVRPGNPLHIKGWDDLIEPGVKIVTPDPATSGSAKWNILAAYAHGLGQGGPAAAKSYLGKFFGHVVSKPDSGADATTAFLAGTGNVLISYENEAIAAKQTGKKLDYIVPADTFQIQNPVAVTTSASAAAKRFLAYVESDAGQRVLARVGFRPLNAKYVPATVKGANDPANPYPAISKLETIADLGGWSKVNAEFFDPKNGIVTKIEAAHG